METIVFPAINERVQATIKAQKESLISTATFRQ